MMLEVEELDPISNLQVPSSGSRQSDPPPSVIFPTSARPASKRTFERDDSDHFVARPRSTGLLADNGFKFSKASKVTLDFVGTRKGALEASTTQSPIAIPTEASPTNSFSLPSTQRIRTARSNTLPADSKVNPLEQSTSVTANGKPTSHTLSEYKSINEKSAHPIEKETLSKARIAKNVEDHLQKSAEGSYFPKYQEALHKHRPIADLVPQAAEQIEEVLGKVQGISQQIIDADKEEELEMGLKPHLLHKTPPREDPTESDHRLAQDDYIDAMQVDNTANFLDKEVVPASLPMNIDTDSEETTGPTKSNKALLDKSSNCPSLRKSTFALMNVEKPALHHDQKIKNQPNNRVSAAKIIQPNNAYTTSDIVKILGNKLEQEQKQTAEAARLAYKEVEEANGQLNRDNQALRHDLRVALRKKTVAESNLQDQKALTTKLHDKTMGFATYMKGLGSDFDDLRREHNSLKKQGISLAEDQAAQFQESREDVCRNIAAAEENLKHIKRENEELKFEYMAQLDSLRRFNDELVARLNDKVGELAEQRDRSMKAQQQLESCSKQYESITTSIHHGHADLINELRALLTKADSPADLNGVQEQLQQMLQAFGAARNVEENTQNKLQGVESVILTLLPTLDTSLKRMINGLMTAQAGDDAHSKMTALILSLKDDILECQALQNRVVTLEQSNLDLEDQNQRKSLSLSHLQTLHDQTTLQVAALEETCRQKDCRINALAGDLQRSQELQAKLDMDEQELTQRRQEVQALEATVHEQQTRLQVFSESQHTIQTDNQALHTTMTIANNQITDLEKQLAIVQTQAQVGLIQLRKDLETNALRQEAERMEVYEKRIQKLIDEKNSTLDALNHTMDSWNRATEISNEAKRTMECDAERVRSQQEIIESDLKELQAKLERAEDARSNAEHKLEESLKASQSELQNVRRMNNNMAASQVNHLQEIADRKAECVKALQEKAAIESDCQLMSQQLATVRQRVKEKDALTSQLLKDLNLTRDTVESTRETLTKAHAELEVYRNKVSDLEIELCAVLDSTSKQGGDTDGLQEHSESQSHRAPEHKVRRKANRHSTLRMASTRSDKIISEDELSQIEKDDVHNGRLQPKQHEETQSQAIRLRDEGLEIEMIPATQPQDDFGSSVFDGLGVIEPDAASMTSGRIVIPETQFSSDLDIKVSQFNDARKTQEIRQANLRSSSPLSELGDPILEHVSPRKQVASSPNQTRSQYDEIIAGFTTPRAPGSSHGVTPNSASKMVRDKEASPRGKISTSNDQLPTLSTNRSSNSVLDSQPLRVTKKPIQSVRFADYVDSTALTSGSTSSQSYAMRGPLGSHKMTTFNIQPNGTLPAPAEPISQPTEAEGGSAITLKRSTSLRDGSSGYSNKRAKHDTTDGDLVTVTRNAPSKAPQPPTSTILPDTPYRSPHSHPQIRLRTSEPSGMRSSAKTTPSKSSNKRKVPRTEQRYNLRYSQELEKDHSDDDEI